MKKFFQHQKDKSINLFCVNILSTSVGLTTVFNYLEKDIVFAKEFDMQQVPSQIDKAFSFVRPDGGQFQLAVGDQFSSRGFVAVCGQGRYFQRIYGVTVSVVCQASLCAKNARARPEMLLCFKKMGIV